MSKEHVTASTVDLGGLGQFDVRVAPGIGDSPMERGIRVVRRAPRRQEECQRGMSKIAGSGRIGTRSTINRRYQRATESDIMSQNDDWSPDEPLGTEAFEQGDEALDEGARVDPDLVEAIESDPSLDPMLQVDERELEEAGADFDDPEVMVTLEGGSDDPDGLGRPSSSSRSRHEDEDGWDLDAPSVRSDESAEGSTD